MEMDRSKRRASTTRPLGSVCSMSLVRNQAKVLGNVYGREEEIRNNERANTGKTVSNMTRDEEQFLIFGRRSSPQRTPPGLSVPREIVRTTDENYAKSKKKRKRKKENNRKHSVEKKMKRN